MSARHDVPTRTFSYRDGAIVVRSASAGMLAWMEEFLAPWFEVSRDAPPSAPIVDVRVDGAELGRLVETARATGRDAECFMMDGGAERWPIVRGTDGRDVALDGARGVALRASADDGGARRIDVLAARERPAARMAAVRAVRELAAARAAALGDLPVHGAAVSAEDGVTLFVGPRRAGKSTLLAHALMHPGTCYVANDRAFVCAGDGTAVAHGMPTIVSLRDGALALVPGLAAHLESGAWHYASTIAEARTNAAARVVATGLGERRPPGLSPAQLCAILGTGRVASGALVRVVFPEIAPPGARGQRFALSPLAPDDASTRLLGAGLVAGGASATWVSGAPPRPHASLVSAARALTRTVPSFRCVLGDGAYDAPSVWEAIRATERAAAGASA